MKKEEQKSSDEKPDAPMSKINVPSILLTVLVIIVLNSYFFSANSTKPIPYSEFLTQIEAGTATNIVIADDMITGELKAEEGKPNTHFKTVPAKDDGLTERLYRKNIPFSVEYRNPMWSFLMAWLLPGLFIYFLWSYLGKRMTGMGGGMLSLAKSKAKVYMEKDVRTTFDDVAGIDEAKDELHELVNYLQDPKRYARLGGRAPKGVLLVGPPGTGKTLLAKAVAGEAKVPFFSINGSEFVEMFVGLGAARVRDLFEQARSQAPCILFIDEIDALGKSRAFGLMGSGANDEKEQTLNQLLAEMDGFDSTSGVIMLAATNRPEILDPALLRAGRFDRQIMLSNPDQQGRQQILRVHVKKIKLDPGVDLARIAAMTPGFSGADLENLVNEAALVATRRNAEQVSDHDFSMAIERIVAGLEKKSKVLNAEEKKRVAYHELGHAAVGLALSTAERVQKISIIPRGTNALGFTLQRPLEDRYLLDEQEMMNKIAVLLGGRAAESIYFKNVSTGAADDLAKAGEIARAMVTQFGMSKVLGLENLDVKRAPYLQNVYESSMKPVSEATLREIDLEVKSILDTCFQTSVATLKQHGKFIEIAAAHLLKSETLDEQQIKELWDKN